MCWIYNVVILLSLWDESVAQSGASSSSHPPSPLGASSDAVSPPELQCDCRLPLSSFTANTEHNPHRRFLVCSLRVPQGGCKVWIWEDLLHQYADEMVKYRNYGATQTLDDLKYSLDEKNRQIERLQDDIKNCHRLLEDSSAKLRESEEQRVFLTMQRNQLDTSGCNTTFIAICLLLFLIEYKIIDFSIW
uniref:Zinc finger GRF-type domain-containing protein n=1 Tax=Oryza glumipatula TaxID=40148 RepID=A0A0D9YAP1_9ORYZ